MSLPGKIPPLSLALGFWGCLAAVIPAAAQQPAAQQYFTDVVLVNQDGEEMRLYSDLLQGKVVVINSFSASCQQSCPVINGNLARLQDWLGDRLGSEVFLVSITTDPINDTPARLRAYAERFHARPGWIFLSGPGENIEFALSKLGQNVENKEDHSTIVFVGNEPAGLWKKVFGLAPPESIFQVVESVLNDD